MACEVHDLLDPTLIIKGSWRPQPSKRVQGYDYPITPLEELCAQDKGKLTLKMQFFSNSISTGIQQLSEPVITTKPTGNVLKDVSKPDGKACHEDGMLKDASEIASLHLPS
jgi:hypothetical protein